MLKFRAYFKRVVTLALCFALMLGMTLEVGAAAQRLSVESKNAKPGDTVNIKVSLEGNPGICAFMLVVTYDGDKLEYQSNTLGSSFQSALSNAADGRVTVLWDDTKDFKGNGTIVTFAFKVKQNASGEAAVSARFSDCYSFNDTDVTFEQGRGSVTIMSGTTTTPTTPTVPTTPTTPTVPSASEISFSDKSKIDHIVAVEKLVGLGIIGGFEDGTFRPDNNVTRAQMAKMISIAKLGDVSMSDFKRVSTILKDVDGHWGEAYIKYCYSQDIIGGRGNGMFDPDAYVTTVEAAKMLLVALGYSASEHGYVGSEWAASVIRDAQGESLFDRLNNTGAFDAMDRDDAAQMICNMLTASGNNP